MNELYKLFREFKLVNSVHTARVSFTRWLSPYIDEEVIKRELAEKWARSVLINKTGLYEEIKYEGEGQKPDEIVFELQAVVVKPSELRTLVEAVIQIMSQEVIDQIKRGGEIPKEI